MSRRPLYNIFFCQKLKVKNIALFYLRRFSFWLFSAYFYFQFFSWGDYFIPRLFEIKGGVAKNVLNQYELKRKAEISLLGF